MHPGFIYHLPGSKLSSHIKLLVDDSLLFKVIGNDSDLKKLNDLNALTIFGLPCSTGRCIPG